MHCLLELHRDTVALRNFPSNHNSFVDLTLYLDVLTFWIGLDRREDSKAREFHYFLHKLVQLDLSRKIVL